MGVSDSFEIGWDISMDALMGPEKKFNRRLILHLRGNL